MLHVLLLSSFLVSFVAPAKGALEDDYNVIHRQWLDSLKAATADILRDSIIRQDGDSMKLWWTTYGDKPADGRSLWISLHGGGGTTPEVNDQQWRNQMRLYRPAEGVYVAPRSPLEAWDMWCQQPIDSMYRTLIRTMIAHYDVSPDKVYILGYSAGGDGVWRMAPRMADSWAAASMMAGHPGDVRLENLRNTPFMIWCGALDKAYNRNEEDRLRGLQMDSLQQADPAGYVHETHIVKKKAHWMDRVDTVAVAWMAQYRRNPYPERIVWRQEEVTHPYFYWLEAPANELQRGKTVRVERHGNVVDIDTCDYSTLTLYFNDEMLDLDKEVSIRYQGQTVFNGLLPRFRNTLDTTLHQRGDLSYTFSASYIFKK